MTATCPARCGAANSETTCRPAAGSGMDVGPVACPGGRPRPTGQGVGDEPLPALPGTAGPGRPSGAAVAFLSRLPTVDDHAGRNILATCSAAPPGLPGLPAWGGGAAGAVEPRSGCIEREVIAAAEGAGCSSWPATETMPASDPLAWGRPAGSSSTTRPARSCWPEFAPGIATIRPRLLIRPATGRCSSAAALIPSRAARPVTRGQRRDRRHSMDSAAASVRHRDAGPPLCRDNEACEVGFRVERM